MATSTMTLTVADKLRMSRAKAELSLDQMAHSISIITGNEISRETVRRWEKAKSSPDIATLEAVAEVTGLSFGWLVGVSPLVNPGYLNVESVTPAHLRINSMSDEEYGHAVFRGRKSLSVLGFKQRSPLVRMAKRTPHPEQVAS